MRRRLLSFGAATMLAAVLGLVQVAEVPVEGQSATTAWGHPNLEGIWLDVYDTPFERSPEIGDREFATPEERQARDQARMIDPGRNERSGAAARDVAGAYNAKQSDGTRSSASGVSCCCSTPRRARRTLQAAVAGRTDRRRRTVSTSHPSTTRRG